MNAVSMYCGAGGMDVGFQQAGFDIVLATDMWRDALSTYSKNNPDAPVLLGDASDLADDIMSVGRGASLVFGGPPCQDFSSAGLRSGDGTRADQIEVFAIIAARINPQWIVMENVNTLRSIGKRHLDTIRGCLKDAGYGITEIILNAADYGAPQNRKRFFLVARKGGVNNDVRLVNALDHSKTARKSVRECLPDIDTNYYYRHPWSYKKRAVFSVDGQSPTAD